MFYVNGRKVLKQGINRKMDEIELEEGEACSYHNNVYDGEITKTTLDPDVDSSIDEKLQNCLGHFKKDFEGVVSAESLGAKYGAYGSFLPAHRRSPHSRTPPRVQNNITSQSLNTSQVEGGHYNSLLPANVSSSIKQGSASPYAYKPPQRNDLSNQNASTKSVHSMKERTPKSDVRDQKTLKVRIKVGSENLSVKKNTAIYSGLGLDWSPTASLDSPMESEGLPCRLSFNSFESPTHIIQIMAPSPLFEGCFLSPLPNNLICLSERSKHLKDFITQLSSKENAETSFIGHSSLSIKGQETLSGVKNKSLVDKKKVFSQHKRDGKHNIIGSPLPLKETTIDDVSCEELVSNALKLPLLSNTHNNLKDAPRASLDDKVFSNVSNSELLEPVSFHVSLNEKPKGLSTSAGKPLQSRAANAGDGKRETEDHTADVGTISKSKKVPKIGLKEPMNQGNEKPSSCDDGIGLPCAIEHTFSEDEKIPKKSQVQGFSTKHTVVETNKDSAKVQKDRKHTDSENKDQRIELQKDLIEVRDQYISVFGEMDELEVDIMDSPDVPTGEMLKSFEDVGTTTLAYENTIRERTSSLNACKGTSLEAKFRGSSNSAFVPENGHPLSEPVPIQIDGNDNWVQCDKCQKWRMFPPCSKVDNLPAEWDCSLMTWLTYRNHCSVSEEESNNFHAPPPDMTAANILSTVVPSNGKITSKVRKISKSSFRDSPNSSSIRSGQSGKDKTMKEVKEPCLINGMDIQQPPKSSDGYSDGGHDKVTNRKGRRASDQEFPRTVKKSKTKSIHSGDDDPAAAHYPDVDIMGVSSDCGHDAAATGKDRVPNSENFALENSKNDMHGIPLDSFSKSKFQVEQLPTIGSVHDSKSGSSNKKRKGDNLKDPPNYTPSSVKLVHDNERSSRKRHRTSKSEGKESSSSKRSGKADKKSKNVLRHKLDTNKSLPKDSSCVNPVAATSSSSKVSGSLKVKCKFQEVKGSPVESVSSSPLRILNSDKLASDSKAVIVNSNVQDAVKMETKSPIRCSTTDCKGDQLGATRKDLFASESLHDSPNYSLIDIKDKNKGTIQLTNGNGCINNVKLENGYPSEGQASHRCVNQTTGVEVQLDANVSNSDKNQKLKSNSVKVKVKESGSCENSLDYIAISKERERYKKLEVDEKGKSNTDKTENCRIMHNKEPSLSKSEGRQEYDESKFSKKFEMDKSEDMASASAKEKSRQLPHCDGDKNETSIILQPCQGTKASTSACDARPDSGLPRDSKLNKKSDSRNGSHFPSKHSISNGNRIGNQDAPSPLRRDSSSQAASSAIKEAKDLKHLADRLKSSGSTDSTGMYFEAALKFLHGASLLESGKSDSTKHADIAQAIPIYSSTAKLCQFCAHEFEKSRDMATAALAYKCVEVAYLRAIYSSNNNASRDRHELQHALQMVTPGESPSSSASDIDNLNNAANGDKVTQARSGNSPQLAGNLVISAKNRPNFSRILSFAQDVNSAMEASRKSRIAFAAANGSMGQSNSKDGIISVKTALDFNFHDVDGLLRLVRLAKEAISLLMLLIIHEMRQEHQVPPAYKVYAEALFKPGNCTYMKYQSNLFSFWTLPPSLDSLIYFPFFLLIFSAFVETIYNCILSPFAKQCCSSLNCRIKYTRTVEINCTHLQASENNSVGIFVFTPEFAIHLVV